MGVGWGDWVDWVGWAGWAGWAGRAGWAGWAGCGLARVGWLLEACTGAGAGDGLEYWVLVVVRLWLTGRIGDLGLGGYFLYELMRGAADVFQKGTSRLSERRLGASGRPQKTTLDR